MGDHDVERVDRGLLVVVDAYDDQEVEANTIELKELMKSAGVLRTSELHVRRPHPDPRFYIGQGNAQEVYLRVQESRADVVVVGEDLSPTQQRNLNEVAQVEVLDRTQLILDIFAQRAHTSEGLLQVERKHVQLMDIKRLQSMSGGGGNSARRKQHG